MPRPTSKTELLQLSQENFKNLIDFVSVQENPNKEFRGNTMNRNIRDVLGHLHHWHEMFLNWYKIGMQGEKPAIPKEGYTFADTPKLNREIWESCQNISLDEVLVLFQKSFEKVFSIIEKHTDEELFTKKKYKWTSSTSLGSYLISATSSHYDWALKLMKKRIKIVYPLMQQKKPIILIGFLFLSVWILPERYVSIS